MDRKGMDTSTMVWIFAVVLGLVIGFVALGNAAGLFDFGLAEMKKIFDLF